MKNLLYLLIPICFFLCLHLTKEKIVYEPPVVCKTAICNQGIAENYTYDNSKGKVVTYIKGLHTLQFWLEVCSMQRFERYAEHYSDFEFIFYLGGITSEEDIEKAVALLNDYSFTAPMYLDCDNEYGEQFAKERISLISRILGANNKPYGGPTTFGDKRSTFDEVMPVALREMEADK